MAKRDVFTAVLRGLAGRCPNCGQGRLFRSYLRPVETCAHCQESLKHIRADDGPAWLTILIVGHIVVGLALYLEMYSPLPVATSIVIFVSLALSSTLLFLPRAKGVFIGAIWAMDATGVEASALPRRR
jgi:uncharacterized protein (DUF983 family)